MVDSATATPAHTGRDLASLDTLTRVADNLAGEFRLEPLLELILRSSVGLLGCNSGSLCLVDPHTSTYRKEVDMEAGCQAGKVFPLTEGMTGAVHRTNAPVAFRHYWQVPGGHLRPGSELASRAVLGVPIRLQSAFIGSLIVFAPDDEREFDDADAQLLQRFATHAAIAMANSRLHAEAADRAKEAAVWAERERSMLDVHDTVDRGLATVLLALEHVESLAREGQDFADPLANAKQAAEAVLRDGRQAVWGMADGLEARPLAETLRHELEWVRATSGVTVTFRTFGEVRPPAPEVRAQLVRIVRESLTNVAKHARASLVRLGLVYGEDGIAVIVEDDGRGFDVADSSGVGVGLSGLIARASQVGGRVQLDSTPGWGTRIRADLPYQTTLDDEITPRHRVVVVHDTPTVRSGIVQLLHHSEPGVQVVAELSAAAEVPDAARLLHPDVVVAGSRVAMADDGWLVAALQESTPRLPVVAVVDEPEAVLQDWVGSGLRGLVPRDADATSLGRAVVAAARGDVMFSGGLLDQLGGLPRPGRFGRLTARELEVSNLLRQGLADKQIASRLQISVKTVEKHVGAVLRKRGVHSRTELLART